MEHLGTVEPEDDSGLLPRLAPSPHSEAVAHEFQELSLQPIQCLPPLNERKNGDFNQGMSVLKLKHVSIWCGLHSLHLFSKACICMWSSAACSLYSCFLCTCSCVLRHLGLP
uniref:Uncharacterized protein n=1 Tax=Podarcis muralis TaxID=64176 RepID=A0A670JQD1_PODMU